MELEMDFATAKCPHCGAVKHLARIHRRYRVYLQGMWERRDHIAGAANVRVKMLRFWNAEVLDG